MSKEKNSENVVPRNQVKKVLTAVQITFKEVSFQWKQKNKWGRRARK